MKIFTDNLNDIMKTNKLKTYEELGEFLNINVNTIKSWISNNRSISLSQLDSIANTLKLPSYLLIKKNSMKNNKHFDTLTNKNNSKKILSSNLQRIFILKSKTTWNEKESLFYGNFSTTSLMAYIRDKDSRTPPLYKVDIMAECMGIEVYLMIKEDAFK